MKKQQGFTMIELMVTVAILAVVVALAMPDFRTWTANRELGSATQKLQGAFQLARLTAVKEHTNVVIWFYNVDNSYRAFVDSDKDNIQDSGERTISGGSISNKVQMTYVFTNWTNQVRFNSKGFAMGWGSVTLNNGLGTKYKKITLWLTGYTKVETSNDGVF